MRNSPKRPQPHQYLYQPLDGPLLPPDDRPPRDRGFKRRHRRRDGRALHRLTLDLPAELYYALKGEAEEEHLTLLELCERLLSAAMEVPAANP